MVGLYKKANKDFDIFIFIFILTPVKPNKKVKTLFIVEGSKGSKQNLN